MRVFFILFASLARLWRALSLPLSDMMGMSSLDIRARLLMMSPIYASLVYYLTGTVITVFLVYIVEYVVVRSARLIWLFDRRGGRACNVSCRSCYISHLLILLSIVAQGLRLL